MPVYYCKKRYASGICGAPASVRAERVDAHVEEQVLAALSGEGGLVAQARVASEALEGATQDRRGGRA